MALSLVSVLIVFSCDLCPLCFTQDPIEDSHSELFHTMEEVCDIVCKASTADLMSMFPQSYQRLQHLLAIR